MNQQYLSQFQTVSDTVYVWVVAYLGVYPTREQAQKVAARYQRLWKTKMFASLQIMTIADLTNASVLRRELREGRIEDYQNGGAIE